jgi:hypothetical protein
MKFFWGDSNGIKADVERHRAAEKRLMEKITELEGKEDPMNIAALRVYRNILVQLQHSKADAVNKIGKRK